MTSKRHFSRRSLFKHTLIPLAAAISTPIVARAQDDYAVERVDVTLPMPRLHPALDGLRVVQMSDLHYDAVGLRPAWLERVVDTVNALQPDVIALTGDYAIDGDRAYPQRVEELAGLLRGLRAQKAVVSIMGNHDYRRGAKWARLLFERAHIRLLVDEVATIERGAGWLHIAGMDDYNESVPQFDKVLAALPDDGAAVALMHEPDVADIIAGTGRFDAQLSGHSHGGQIRNANGQPIVLPRNGQRYHSGLYRVGEMWQYTNRGLGTKPPHVRVNCPPELTVFTLRAGC